MSFVSWPQLAIGAVIGAAMGGIVAFALGYSEGRADGRRLERAASLAAAVELIKKRGETNAEIGGMDDAALCRELDGEWVQSDGICK